MEFLILGSGASEGIPSGWCLCDFCVKARAAGGKNIRTRTAFQLGDTIRVDWGPDSVAQAFRYGLEPWKLRHVFITHSHEDHLFPMDFWSRGVSQLPAGEAGWLHVYGNAESLALIEHAIGGNWEKNRLIPVRVEPGKSIELPEEGWKVTALAANHTSPEQSLMYLFESPGRTLLISGDTDVFPEATLRQLAGCRLDLMTIDATWGMEDRHESHLGIPNGGAIVRQLRELGIADDRTRVIAVHFGHGAGARLHHELERLLAPFGMEPGYDGMRIAVPTRSDAQTE